MALCIREKIFSWSESYEVYDERQNILYRVKGEVFSFGHRIHIYDAQGNEVAFVREKIWTFFKKFEIYLHGELKGMLKERFSWFHAKYDVDFLNCQVNGDIFDWNYEMTREGKPLAHIERKIFSWANVFYLSYGNPEDELTVLALAIAIDAAHHDEENATIMAANSH